MRPFLLFPDPRIGTWSFLRLIFGGVLPLFPLSAGFPPLISREKDGGLPPVTSEKTS